MKNPENRQYTIKQIEEIVKKNGWSTTTCKDEKDGKFCKGIDTIQVALTEDDDYFGEFVGDKDNQHLVNPEQCAFYFKFYI